MCQPPVISAPRPVITAVIVSVPSDSVTCAAARTDGYAPSYPGNCSVKATAAVTPNAPPITPHAGFTAESDARCTTTVRPYTGSTSRRCIENDGIVLSICATPFASAS